MIDNNVHVFRKSTCPSSYHEYKDNWAEESNFASFLARGERYFKIDIFTSKFTPQVSTNACEKYLSES